MRKELKDQLFHITMEACAEGVSLNTFLYESRRLYLRSALALWNGNQTKAAKAAGRDRAVFNRLPKEEE